MFALGCRPTALPHGSQSIRQDKGRTVKEVAGSPATKRIGSGPASRCFEVGAFVRGKLESASEQAHGLFAQSAIDTAFQIADDTCAQACALGQGFLGEPARQALVLKHSPKAQGVRLCHAISFQRHQQPLLCSEQSFLPTSISCLDYAGKRASLHPLQRCGRSCETSCGHFMDIPPVLRHARYQKNTMMLWLKTGGL